MKMTITEVKKTANFLNREISTLKAIGEAIGFTLMMIAFCVACCL